MLLGLEKYLEHKFYILCYEDFMKKKTKNPRKIEIEKSDFYWFGLVFRFNNLIKLVWFGN